MMRKQSGFTLIEVVASLAILGVILALSARMADQYMLDTKNQAAASHTKQVIDASQKYIKDNYAAIVASATPTVPVSITVANLVAGGYLPTGFNATNAVGHTIATYALEPTANQITAVAVTSGAPVINDLDLGVIAAAIGEAGGSIRSSATTTLTGSFGKWAIPLANYGVAPGAGHFGGAIWFDQTGGLVTDYVYRAAVPGHPEANTMTTPLIMSSTQTLAAACTTTGAIARDATGAVLSCQGGVWNTQGSAYWKDAVTNFASLPACNAAAKWQTRVVGTPAIGTQPRAYACDGATWIALGVDNNGNLTLPGSTLYAGSGSDGAYGGLTIQGSKNGWSGVKFKDSAGTDSGTLMMHPSYSGFYLPGDAGWRWYVDNSGNSIQGGTAQMANAVITGTATVGAACSPNGKVAQDGTGLLLSCQSGVWVSNHSCSWYGGDLNTLEGEAGTTSCYNGVGMGNAPDGNWYFVEVLRHLNAGNWYVIQRATGMTGAVANKVYQRSQQSGSPNVNWGAWEQQGGGARFGGTFMYLGNGACADANPQTGACSCPSGTTAHLISWTGSWYYYGYACQ